MYKLLTGSLILILSAFSFSGYSAFSEAPPEWVEPKTEMKPSFACNPAYGTPTIITEGGVCADYFKSFKPLADGFSWGQCTSAQPTELYQKVNFNCDIIQTADGSIRNDKIGSVTKLEDVQSKICPPEKGSDYTRGPMPESADNPDHEVCFSKFPLCPLGYFKFAVEPYGCVPIDCPSKGSSVSNIRTFGKVPADGAGTYCDGTCSYSVSNGVSSSGGSYASGVSNGAVCGNGKFANNSSFTPEDKEDSCTTHALSNGLTFEDCSSAANPDPEPTPDSGTDETDNKVNELETDSPFQGQDCGTVNDKEVCVGKNIVDAIQDQNDKLKTDAAERHNKLIDQQKEISDYVETKNKERETARASDAIQIIDGLDAVKKAVESSGGGGGGSNSGVVSALDGIGDSIGQTGTETDSLPSAGIESFYEAEYPNGFQDVWAKNKALFDASAPVAYIKQWEVSVSGNAPDMDICFDLGSMANFGCKTFEIDPRVFPFLRIIILISTAFLCRALVMGG